MKNISIIGMPMKYGCFVDGADMSFDWMFNSINEIFKNKSICKINTNLDNKKEHMHDKKLKYVEQVMEVSNRLYNKVYSNLERGNFPLIVGGDHSSAIGSVSASLDYYKGDVSVIWFDAHMDIHNHNTSPSGNIHGMPLSICIGRCDDRFNIGNYKLDPGNLYYIGVRSYELEEMNYVREQNITCYMDFETYERGIDKIIDEIAKNIKTKYVHLSFDFDSLSEIEFPSVNVGVNGDYQDNGGFDLETVKKAIELMLTKLNVCSMDIVEYNPLLDEDKKCLKKAEEILEIVNNSLE